MDVLDDYNRTEIHVIFHEIKAFVVKSGGRGVRRAMWDVVIMKGFVRHIPNKNWWEFRPNVKRKSLLYFTGNTDLQYHHQRYIISRRFLTFMFQVLISEGYEENLLLQHVVNVQMIGIVSKIWTNVFFYKLYVMDLILNQILINYSSIMHRVVLFQLFQYTFK